jgi:hypothetical protein
MEHVNIIHHQTQLKELNMSRWIHTIDIIQLLKAGLTDKNKNTDIKS